MEYPRRTYRGIHFKRNGITTSSSLLSLLSNTGWVCTDLVCVCIDTACVCTNLGCVCRWIRADVHTRCGQRYQVDMSHKWKYLFRCVSVTHEPLTAAKRIETLCLFLQKVRPFCQHFPYRQRRCPVWLFVVESRDSTSLPLETLRRRLIGSFATRRLRLSLFLLRVVSSWQAFLL